MSNEPKTEALKFENPFAAFDPIASFRAAQQAFLRMTADGEGRAQAAADQYGALEAQLVQRT